MRVLVCGGRCFGERFVERRMLDMTLDELHAKNPFTVLIEGGATGADYRANRWAKAAGVPVEQFKADWGRYGKAAGPERNSRMLTEGRPDLVIAFPGGRGTADMVDRAKGAGISVQVVPLIPEDLSE
jgi:hypothetical protein